MHFFAFIITLFISTIAKADYVFVPLPASGNGAATYANAGALPLTGNTDGAMAITLDDHALYIWNQGATTWELQTGSTGLGGPGTSVNNEIMLFSGTGGDTAKRATGTGVVKATSGVYSTGTVTVAEGGTGSTTAADARTALSAAKSGDNTDLTSIVMGNGATRCIKGDSDTSMCFTADGSIDFKNNDFDNFKLAQNYVYFKNVPYVFPGVQGSANEYLKNDGSGNLDWSPLSLDTLAVTKQKTTTGSETMNYVHTDLDPTGNADSITILNVDGNIETDHDVANFNGLVVQVDAQQDGDTTGVLGSKVTSYIGRDDAATTIGNVNTSDIYVEVQDQTTISGGIALRNDTANSDNGSTIAQFNGHSIGGNLQGTVTNYQAFGANHDIGAVTSYNGVNFGGTIGLTGGMNGFNFAWALSGTQAENNGFNLFNEGTNLGDLNSYIGWSHHPTADSIRYDYNVLEAGANIGDVGRNVNTANFHNTFATVNGSYTGIAEGSNFGTLTGGNATNMNLNFQGSVPGDAVGIGIFPQITQRTSENQIITVFTTADVNGSLGGDYFRMCSAYSENPNECIKVWYDVDNASSAPSADGDTLVEVDISEDDSAADVASASATVINALAKFNATSSTNELEITVVADGRAGGADTGNIGWNWNYVQGGGGDGTFTGVSFGGGQLSGYSENNIIAFNSGGYPVSFGRINAFTNYSIVSSTPNPANVHTIGTNFSVGDSQTITDGDVLGVGGIGQVSVGDGSTVTSGGLKVGATSAGKISLMQAGTGSSMENVTSDLAASILVAGSGTFTNVSGYRAVNANFGASTPMTNYRAFFADTPAGPGAATNTWALYADGTFLNWMGGSLKIGGTAGSTDQVSDSSISLEVEGLTATEDLQITNTRTPSSASDTCTQGTVTWDTNYIYVCVATDTWKRTALATW